MSEKKQVTYWHSLQSPYCYFLIDRLLWLETQNVSVEVRPVLGLVLRAPELTAHRSDLEKDYFDLDVARIAAFLNLPYGYPDPPPIAFDDGPGWVASAEQPILEHIFRLFVGAVRAGRGLAFLDQVVRKLWDGSTPGWHEGPFLKEAMARAGLDHDAVMVATSWASAQQELNANHLAMLEAGHWGVPLMAYEGEAFYGQDRFDQLIWRMGLT